MTTQIQNLKSYKNFIIIHFISITIDNKIIADSFSRIRPFPLNCLLSNKLIQKIHQNPIIYHLFARNFYCNSWAFTSFLPTNYPPIFIFFILNDFSLFYHISHTTIILSQTLWSPSFCLLAHLNHQFNLQQPCSVRKINISSHNLKNLQSFTLNHQKYHDHMKGTCVNLFTKDRFELFTGMSQNIEPNNQFYAQTKKIEYDVVTPSEKNDPKQFLLHVIQKKDAQIRQLKRKLRLHETSLTQTKQKLDSTNYELQYFKRKMCEQFSKSKEIQTEIELINKKVLQMISNLSCVKKLKNPLQLRQHNLDLEKVTKKLEAQNANQRAGSRVDLQCLRHLEKVVIKVASVIETAFKLKKVKSDKNLINILDKQAGFESMEKERSMAS